MLKAEVLQFFLFAPNPAIAAKNICVEKNRKFMKNVGCFYFGTWQQAFCLGVCYILVCGGSLCGVCLFFFFAFGGFNGFVVCFCVLGKVANVLKCVFSQLFWFFWGALFLFTRVWKV